MFSDSHAALHCSWASNDDSYNTFNLHISALRQHSIAITPQSTSLGFVFDYISATHYHTVEKTSQHHVSNRSRTQVTSCIPIAAVFEGNIKQQRSSHHCTCLYRQTGTAQATSNNRVHHLITAPASTDRQTLHRRHQTTKFIISSQYLPPQTDKHCTGDIKQQSSSSHHSTCLHRQTVSIAATAAATFSISQK